MPGEGRIEVTGQLSTAGMIEITVRDFGRWRPSRPGASGGRGLSLMKNLMDDVSIDSTTTGTTVRLSLAVASDASAGT